VYGIFQQAGDISKYNLYQKKNVDKKFCCPKQYTEEQIYVSYSAFFLNYFLKLSYVFNQLRMMVKKEFAGIIILEVLYS